MLLLSSLLILLLSVFFDENGRLFKSITPVIIVGQIGGHHDALMEDLACEALSDLILQGRLPMLFAPIKSL